MDENEYIQHLLSEIEVAKNKKLKGLFKINEQISSSTADAIKRYFKGNPEYSVELRKCKSCKNVWDIIIFFIW